MPLNFPIFPLGFLVQLFILLHRIIILMLSPRRRRGESMMQHITPFWSIAEYRSDDFGVAAAAPVLFHDDLPVDPLLQFRNVRNDSDQTVALREA